MSDTNHDLPTRYFIAETSVFLLGGLLVSRYFGIAPPENIPFLNVQLPNEEDVPRVIAGLLVAVVVYLALERTYTFQGSVSPRRASIRFYFIMMGTIAVLWVSYPAIAAKTRFAVVSPAWLLAFVFIGFLIGTLLSVLIIAALMIRTKQEATQLRLPRVPVLSGEVFVIYIPVSVFLIGAYYVLWWFSPPAISDVVSYLACIPVLYMIADIYRTYFLFHDKDGRRVPYATRRKQLMKAADFYDYSCLLDSIDPKAVEAIGIPTDAGPDDTQKAFQRAFSADSRITSIHFQAHLLETVTLQLVPRDGAEANPSIANASVRVCKREGRPESLLVRVVPDGASLNAVDISIPSSALELHAERYLTEHAIEDESSIQKLILYALNQSVIDAFFEQSGPALLRAAMMGQEDEIEHAIQQDVNVNEQGEFGWTALLYAAAQGYVPMMRKLLDAGANPDIGNVNGVTPIMYGARYGNVEVCELLLEFGANVNLQDLFGETALMVAIRQGSADVAAKLIDAGADYSIQNRQDMTALDLAHEHKQGAIAKRLRTSAKDVNSE